MTLEELLESSAEQLEKLTDNELEEFFKPMFLHCRPQPIALRQFNKPVAVKIVDPKKQKMLQLLKEQGVDISRL